MVTSEGTYQTQLMDHVPMEPESGLAYVDPSGVLNVVVGTQYPYRDRRQIAPALGLPMNRVRVLQAPIGGGFGRKDDITTEIHVGLLALKTGRPVRLVYTRADSLIANTKRHPFLMKFRTGARADGTLVLRRRRHLRRYGSLPVSRPLRHQEGGHPRLWPLPRPQHPRGHLHPLHQQPYIRRLPWLRRTASSSSPRVADGQA